MKVGGSMDNYAARLASFNATLTSKKKRSSEVKGTKILTWPHQVPSPPQLAKAGFFYKPTSTSPDNATCYLCHCNLDGWEEDDNPIAEHLKHSPSCGWANTASIEQAVENGERDLEDPSSERLTNARAMTFGSTWPHDRKRGWVCKTQKMVEAGWYYCPTLESDDFVRCAYCSLSLDGWEPKDNPYDEHQRRSPDCTFFSLSAPSQTIPTAKNKKSRPSKASRMSTQSSFSRVSEAPSVMDIDLQDNGIVPVVESAKTTKSGKGGKKGKKIKAQDLFPKQEDTQLASSFIEPEDDDFEVKVVEPPVTKAKGKKRKSEDVDGMVEPSSKSMPKKRRTTRTRNSTAIVQVAPEQLELDQDVRVTDSNEMSQLPKPATKEGGRKGKKRGSSAARKASSKSIASEASLRVRMPNDEEIDAALEEELDRPLTDDGEDDEQETFIPIKVRRLTRTKPGLKATNASTASTRRTTRTSTVTIEDSVAEPHLATTAAHESEEQFADDVEIPLAEPLPIAKASKKTGMRKASAKQKAKDQAVEAVEKLPAQADVELATIEPKELRGQKPSQEVVNRPGHTSNILDSQNDVDTLPKTDSSTIVFQGPEDDLCHDADANTNGGPKRGRKASAAKKTKAVKKLGPKSRTIDDVLQPAVTDQLVAELQGAAEAPTNDFEHLQPAAEEAKRPSKMQTKALRTEPKRNGKNAASKSIEAEEFATDIHLSEEERRIDEPSSPPACSVHSTPRPAPSPQSSDAENQPPSSRPSQSRPPLSFESAIRSQEARIPLALITTPSTSLSRGNHPKLQSSLPWTAMDIDQIFHGTPDTEKENQPFAKSAKLLTSPEKKLTVEEWIKFNAQRGEAKLRNDCERLVGRFEEQGVRALRTIEGIICID